MDGSNGAPATPSHALLPALSPSSTTPPVPHFRPPQPPGPAPMSHAPLSHTYQDPSASHVPHAHPGAHHPLPPHHSHGHQHHPQPQPYGQYAPAPARTPTHPSHGTHAHHVTPQHQHQHGQAGVFNSVMGAVGQVPQDDAGAGGGVKVYASAYSQIPVYEAMIRNISVMRRMADGWVNATQILKVAGISKSIRTKILEKQVQTQHHEKVQGGYGKYQGTWIPLERGRELAEQYGVGAFVAPIFDFDPPPSGLPALPLRTGTPSAQKTPAPSGPGRIIPPFTHTALGAPPPQPQFIPSGTQQPQAPPDMMQQGMMYPPQHAHMYYPPPGPYREHGGLDMAPTLSSASVGGSTHGLAPAASINGHGLPPPADVYLDAYGQPQYHAQAYELEPAAKRIKTDSEGELVSEATPTGDEDALEAEADDDNDDDDLRASSPLPTSFRLASKPYRPKPSAASTKRRAQWIALFGKDGEADVRGAFGLGPDDVPDWDVDAVIDELGNTPLHWACAMAKTDLVAQLVVLGADVHRGNYRGETPLVRSVLARNQAEAGTFPDLLDRFLGHTVRTLDHSHQTVLHHAAYMAGLAGRAAAARTYVASVLEWVAKEQQALEAGLVRDAGLPPHEGEAHVNAGLNLKRLVDVQDVHGDTALNVAARVGSKPLVKLLLDAGADKAKANKLDLKPVDFGVEVEALAVSERESAVSNLKSEVRKPEKRSADVLRNISALFDDLNKTFDGEMEKHVEELNAIEKEVRAATRRLAEQRQAVARAQARVAVLDRLGQRADNIQRALSAEHDFTGRAPLPGEPAVPPDFAPLDADIDVDVGPGAAASGDIAVDGDLKRLQRLRRWEQRVARVLEDKVRAMEGESAGKAVMYRKVVALCAKVPVENVDGMLDGLTAAVESDGQSLDLSRIASLMSRVREVQSA
ncbi:transcriptional regulator swi6 [Cryptotrichosporon argae]